MKQILSSIFILLLFALEAHPASNASLYLRVKAAYEYSAYQVFFTSCYTLHGYADIDYIK